jgi:hypothetical protein
MLWQFVFPIATGYAAKNLCSCLYIKKQSQEYSEANDLNFSLIKFTSNKVNQEEKLVKSTLLGLKANIAIFRGDKFGCTLIGNKSELSSKVLPKINEKNILKTGDSIPFKPINPKSPLSKEINSILKREFEDKLIATRAIIVIRDGEIVGEKYEDNFDQNSQFLSWSITKSVTAVMVGILIQKGEINLEDRVPIEEWKNIEFKDIQR